MDSHDPRTFNFGIELFTYYDSGTSRPRTFPELGANAVKSVQLHSCATKGANAGRHLLPNNDIRAGIQIVVATWTPEYRLGLTDLAQHIRDIGYVLK